jgi:hypothetical protein
MSENRDMSKEPTQERRRSPVRAAAGVARIGAAAWWRTTIWTTTASVRVSSRVMRAAASGQPPVDLFRSGARDARAYARRVLGIVDPEQTLRSAANEIPRPSAISKNGGNGAGPARTLRERGAELLRQSADVNFEEEAHPAYARILDDLAPDEARILRLLVLEGPQPSVDVRSGWLPIDSASELIAPGISMIGAEAGCRCLNDVHAYLNNLFRLGLIWFSREPVADPLRYQVLEAQPDVIDAMERAGRGRTVRRSIELTPFGRDFCELCLPLETAEFEALGRSALDAKHDDRVERPQDREEDGPAGQVPLH